MTEYGAADHLEALSSLHLSRRARRELRPMFRRALARLGDDDGFVTISDALWDGQLGLLVVTEESLWFLGLDYEDIDVALDDVESVSVERSDHPGSADLVIETAEEVIRLDAVGNREWAHELASVISGRDDEPDTGPSLECPACGAALSAPLPHRERCPSCGMATD